MAIITDYWGLDGIIIFATLIIIAYLYMTRNFKYWEKQGVMEITPTPFVGNFMECLLLKKPPAYFLKELYERAKDEPYIGFYVFDKPYLLLRDREIIQNVMIKDFNIFFNRYASSDPNDRIGSANLFFIKNPAWKIIRTKLTPFFTTNKLKKMFDLMLECGKHLDDYIDSLKLDGMGQIIDVKDISSKLTMDIISSTAYGLDVNCFKDPTSDFRNYGKKIFKNNYRRGWEWLAMFFLPELARITKVKLFGEETTEYLRKIFWETINRRMESGEKRYDLIDILIELKKNNSNEEIEGFKFDGDDLMAQAASFFSAGFDTSAVPIAFTLYELALQPEIQSTLRKEIIEALNNSDGNITYDMITSLSYLDMVVLETLRKYPSLGFLNRIAMQDYKVPNSNLVLKKGTPVYIPMLGLHYDPKYFPDPDKYDPERFNEKNKRNIPACVYFPFGEGPHACIGTRFGYLIMKFTLMKLLNKYEVAPCKKTTIPVIIDPAIAMTSPLDGVIYLNLRKINAAE
ncbi:PREDICTED: cytochrome P450 6k1-like [Vollenhovia emeryi]|uniref:cytochrome P450 6k1-like n=1 Tax=Vollenhovia emeryi TaxID=411798 RepID=UPI0005F4DA84|nr:PREDICTED: cytochrome P450 6k1-like [Vollenhovia emeryi]XP_011866376.1 PREDICTED: cytochrome P450 6k1-like [Vollenhovia emeryi]